jgi:hypothetical protein
MRLTQEGKTLAKTAKIRQGGEGRLETLNDRTLDVKSLVLLGLGDLGERIFRKSG